MPTIRAFVAIPLEPFHAKAVVRLIERMRPDFPGVRWVAEQTLHVTVAFLGDVSDSAVPAIAAALESAACEHQAFELSLYGVGAFPSTTRPQTLWIGIREGAPQTIALYDTVASRLEPLGYRREDRPYTPHLTIGRVQRPGRPATALAGRFRKFADWDGGVMEVSQLQLMSSQLSPKGPIYTPLSRAMLGGDSAIQ